MQRRHFLRAGILGAHGLNVPTLCRLRAETSGGGQARGAILVWLGGGPSHHDTFDPKPDALAEVRGEFTSIATSVPGIRVSEALPRLARGMQHLAVIRSVTHPDAAHEPGAAHMQTGYAFRAGANYPGLGSVVAHECRDRAARVGLPPAIVVPRGTLGAGHLGPAHNPFEVAGDPNDPAFRVQDLALPNELAGPRLERRSQLLSRLDEPLRQHPAEIHGAVDRFTEQAFRLLTSPRAQQAFEIEREPGAVRERYGRTPLGQSLLLARRLIEAEVPFVTVNDDGWDHHVGIYPSLRTQLPPLDRGVGALVEDLATRGLLESTLVIVMGEFGRTPRVNANRGRDHWPRAFSVVLAGGGVRGGQTIGVSDGEGAFVADRPVTPEDLACSIFTLLGIDPDKELPTISGRRIQIVRDGQFIRELL